MKEGIIRFVIGISIISIISSCSSNENKEHQNNKKISLENEKMGVVINGYINDRTPCVILQYISNDSKGIDCFPSCAYFEFTDGLNSYYFNLSAQLEEKGVHDELVIGEKYVLGFTSIESITGEPEDEYEWYECDGVMCKSTIVYLNSYTNEINQQPTKIGQAGFKDEINETKNTQPIYKVLDVACYECSECTFTVIDETGKKLKLDWELMPWMVGTGETTPCYDQFIEKYEGKECFESTIGKFFEVTHDGSKITCMKESSRQFESRTAENNSIQKKTGTVKKFSEVRALLIGDDSPIAITNLMGEADKEFTYYPKKWYIYFFAVEQNGVIGHLKCSYNRGVDEVKFIHPGNVIRIGAQAFYSPKTQEDLY